MKKQIQDKGKIAAGFLLLIMISHPIIFGQAESTICDDLTGRQLSASHLMGTPYRDLNPYSPVIRDVNQWGTGTVYLQSGDSVTNRYLIYNAVGSNLLWTKYDNESSLLIDKSTVKGFSILSEITKQNIRYEYFPIANWYYTDGDGAFFEVLVKDTISLYRLGSIEKFPMSQDLKIHRYYFLYDGTNLNKVMRNRRVLCASLEHSKEFRKHLIGKHIRVRRQEGMIHAIKEYNAFIKAL